MNKTMLLVLTVICVIALSYYAGPVFGDDAGTDAATCAITVTVDSIVEWEGANFAAINLAAITAQASAPTGSAVYTLWTNSNVELSADNLTDPNMALLTHSRDLTNGEKDSLVTKYQMETDGDGDPATGATGADIITSHADDWVEYDSFLATALPITHVNTDGNVEVTLRVQATNDSDNVADQGAYSATQTITATWTSDN